MENIHQRKGSWKFFRVHFPGSEIIVEPSGRWDSLELEFPKCRGSREDWVASKRVISYEKLKWTVFSFQPYKSPGIGGIMPIMLQQSFELLAGKLLLLLLHTTTPEVYVHFPHNTFLSHINAM
jgi:hypothetical protein